jgi:hypothetical protein
MKALEVTAEIDSQHCLKGAVPPDLRPGRVRVIILVPDEDEASEAWERGVARQWAAELGDAREDIYTLNDGEPEDAAG